MVDPALLEAEIVKFAGRNLKIGAFTAASNVSGIIPDYRELARIMHRHQGLAFIDFAASAPYVDIDMHPADDPGGALDAIYFSPHKFLGGPGSPGVLVFNRKLYNNMVPDQPGGGTVDWTNPWGQHKFVSSIEAREDGGTPAFLQAIKAALCIKLKEEMNVEMMRKREEELVNIAFDEMLKIPGLHILAHHIKHRLGAISFYVDDIHYNLIVKLLNDRYGVQTRGGCSCAGTYGHYLLHVDPQRSKRITDKIDQGDLSEKPGWVRMSIHPTMTNDELYLIINALKEIVANIDKWEKDYTYDIHKNEFFHISMNGSEKERVKSWFDLSQKESVEID